MNLNIRNSKWNGLFSAVIASIILLNACNDKDDPGAGQQPVMPPASSMEPDFSYFNEENNPNGRVETVNNWLVAAANVTFYSSILGSHLVVPVTAYKVALQQEATFDTELDIWVWAYETTVGSAGTFQVRLTADVSNSGINWTGYISKEGSFEDFIWFEGTSEIGGEAGTWTLYENHTTGAEWLSAEWSKSDVEGKANVKFTVEAPGDHLGSSISYAINETEGFNRSVIIVDTNVDNTVTAHWNSETKIGRVKSPAHYQDEDFHCWDGTLQDTDCQ